MWFKAKRCSFSFYWESVTLIISEGSEVVKEWAVKGFGEEKHKSRKPQADQTWNDILYKTVLPLCVKLMLIESRIYPVYFSFLNILLKEYLHIPESTCLKNVVW